MDQSSFPKKNTHNQFSNILHYTVRRTCFFPCKLNLFFSTYVKYTVSEVETLQTRRFIQFSTWNLPCISDCLFHEQASYEKHVKASFWLHCREVQTSLPLYRAPAGVRGPLNQLLCGSVNRVNVTHFVENYTSTTASFGPIWSR